MKAIRLLITFIILLLLVNNTLSETVSEREKERMKLNKKFDKHRLREKDDFVVDRSKKFLVEPKEAPAAGDFIVAKTPPTVKMRIIPGMEPEYFTNITLDSEVYMVAWANWAYVTRSEDNRFFFSVSDHRGNGCNLFIYEYSPARNVVDKVVDFGNVVGWTENTLTDGKIHGHMGIMPDGTLWAASHHGVVPDSSWWANGFRGSWLISYNIFTHEAKNWGVPLVGNSLPCFNVDTRRGRLLGTCSDFSYTILCWDCINKKVRFAGCPPNGWIWWDRAMLCDEKTGKFWSMDDDSEKMYRFLSFDPEFNRFERYDLTPPENPYSHEVDKLRGHTDRPAMDGWFYWATWNGAFFRFKPEGPNGPVVEPLGTTWDKGRDTLQMALSPGGRYVYYFPKSYPSPVVQYDVMTGTKKALCWLQDYYHDKYGYWMDHCYGMEISKDGSYLVIVMNGVFQGRVKAFGHPSLIVIEIPEEERVVD